jgi:hypothetical protein
MSKPSPKYTFNFRWGNFQLSIVGRGAILWWGGFLAFLLGLKILVPKLITQLL